MSKIDLVNKLLTLDVKLATQALKNDRLTAKLKVSGLLKELNLQVKS